MSVSPVRRCYTVISLNSPSLFLQSFALCDIFNFFSKRRLVLRRRMHRYLFFSDKFTQRAKTAQWQRHILTPVENEQKEKADVLQTTFSMSVTSRLRAHASETGKHEGNVFFSIFRCEVLQSSECSSVLSLEVVYTLKTKKAAERNSCSACNLTQTS